MKHLWWLSIIFATHASSNLQKLERPNGTILKAFFTPQDNITENMVDLIENEQTSISIMIYFFTDMKIAKALQRAQKRNVIIKLIVDHSMATNPNYNRTLKKLRDTCHIRVYQPIEDGIMHNKFVIFEKNINNKSLIWTGSFNFTHRAQYKNIENVVISNDQELVAAYQQIFDSFYKKSIDFKDVEDKPKKDTKIFIEVFDAVPQQA